VLKSQEFTQETEEKFANIWSEYMQRLKDSSTDDTGWDHLDFVKQIKEQEEKVRQEIIRDRELPPS
jgi:hypothetical protein